MIRPEGRARAHGRVLVLDDEAEDLGFVAALLAEAGYEVVPATAMTQARTLLLSERFDLVLSDLYLGGEAHGFEISATADSLQPAVPVILLTGHASFMAAQEAVRTKAAAILRKPADPAEILTACRRAIHETQIRTRSRRLEVLNRVLAQVLPRAIEAKDPTTSGHADRVVHYVDLLAERCGVGDADREQLRLAALLHDVGKIGIPDQILRKEGPLTADERKVVEQHPEMGYEILAALEDHDNVRVWVYQHHERWDGRGYPNRLRGDEVALAGRILILAEVYDALAEPRSYKGAWPVDRIVALFRSEAGKHFDPDLAGIVADGLERDGRQFFLRERGCLWPEVPEIPALGSAE
jgi:putative two-component system response regulator